MKDQSETVYNLIILLTTANFPDVMLPAYNLSWTRVIFFIVFISFGLYFWLNLILASLFNIFKMRIASKDRKNREKRLKRIVTSMNKFASENVEYLEYYQMKKFLAFIYDW